MTLAQMRKRATVLRNTLANMSFRGWDKFKATDYQPLEKELRGLDAAIALRRRK